MKRRDFLVACVFLPVGFQLIPTADAQLPSEVTVIKRQIRFNLTLTNPKPYELVDQALWLYLPIAETATQKLEDIHISIPYEQATDKLGQTVITLNFPKMAPFSSKAITITINISLSKLPKLEALANQDLWLGTERYIETTDLSIIELAKGLQRAEPSETALAIYGWASQNIAYLGYTADDRGAAYALTKRQGDYTENAYLVVALARANGVPARMVGGYNIDNNAILMATDYHNWAELYFDGAWHLLDAQKQRYLMPAENYVAFHYYYDQAINPIGLAHRYSQRGEFEVGF